MHSTAYGLDDYYATPVIIPKLLEMAAITEPSSASRTEHHHHPNNATGFQQHSFSNQVCSVTTLYEPEIGTLPPQIQRELEELNQQLEDEEITEKGYQKKRATIMSPFLKEYKPLPETEELIEPAMEKLPSTAIESLRILKEELDNDEITEKGYVKKRAKILAPYMLKEPKREALPVDIQFKYKELDNELHDGDITEKGYKKRKMKLIHPYLVAVHPSSYKRSSSKRFCAVKAEVKQEPHGLQHEEEVLEDGKKLFKCKICGDTFKLAQSYSGHCRLHRGEREKYFKCTFCNATYTSNSHLKYHMYKHTGDFPYTCAFCGKGFAGRSQLKYHELRHTGEAPHSCSECGSRFWKLGNLRDHQKKGCLGVESNMEHSNIKDNNDITQKDTSEQLIELGDDDLPPSMTNDRQMTYSASSTSSSPNCDNHYISLPPPDESSMLNSNIKMKSTTETKSSSDYQ